jgi:hypothetical protein
VSFAGGIQYQNRIITLIDLAYEIFEHRVCILPGTIFLERKALNNCDAVSGA